MTIVLWYVPSLAGIVSSHQTINRRMQKELALIIQRTTQQIVEHHPPAPPEDEPPPASAPTMLRADAREARLLQELLQVLHQSCLLGVCVLVVFLFFSLQNTKEKSL